MNVFLRSLGLLIVFASLFLQEPEERAVSEIIKRASEQVKNRARVAAADYDMLLRISARLSLTLFTRLFGSKLLSLQSLGVSTCFGLASWFTEVDLFFSGGWRTAVWASIFLVLGILPAIVKTRYAVAITCFCALSALAGAFLARYAPRPVYGLFFEVPFQPADTLDLSTIFFVGALELAGWTAIAGALFDTLWVALNRGLMSACLSVKSSLPLAAWTTSSAIATGLLLASHSWVERLEIGQYPDQIPRVLAYAVLMSRSFLGVISAATLATFILLFVWRISPPIMSRLMLPITRSSIFENRKTMAAVGILLMEHKGALEIIHQLFEMHGS